MGIKTTKDMIEKAPSLVLPEQYRWLEARIDKSRTKVSATIEIANENMLIFNSGLFRSGEFITFEALVELPDRLPDDKNKFDLSEHLLEQVKPKHRIADSRKASLLKSLNKSRSILPSWFMFLYVIGFGGFLAYKSYDLYRNPESKFYYRFYDESGNERNVEISGANSGKIKISDYEKAPFHKFLGKNKDDIIVDVDEFKNLRLEPVVVNSENKIGLFILLIITLLMLVMSAYFAGLIKQAYKFRKMLKIIEK